ncbi:MAG: putative pterin-4-alpha-carbinolamine dehydratase [Verrucomicrobia subdivision 3 bacterium]|nr:putative pterin-4-alpha-carbinolamine dehydratase [Limisphaerales bacterium]MCS1414416.1 putative pterin-4-alpha-carbinolamine dehydratase [Limisphaerales bacterium]
MALLSETEIQDQFKTIPEWQRAGKIIAREFQFKDFPAAIRFVDQIAVAAEEAWHHPDIDIRWNKVRLALTTHDQGGLTAKDFELAQLFDQISDASSA